MESAIALLVFVLIVLLIIPAVVSLNSNAKIKALGREVDLLKKYIIDLHKSVELFKNLPQTQKELASEKEQNIQSAPVTPTREVKKAETVKPDPVPPLSGTPLKPLTESLPEPSAQPKQKEEAVIPQAAITQAASKPITPPLPKKKTNFEQFIGEKLISLVGIGILVLGIFFTVKWAIDRQLISDGGKILIGLGAATVLIAVAHKLSKNYRAFSSILAGGGIAVLYFSVYQAYQSYHLLPQTGAFVAMVLITVFAVVLSLLYDKKELAVIALIGGFCTPFFVSNGSGNYQVLFSYLLILNIGMFAVAVFKKWNLLNLIGYIFTIIIFGVWAYNDQRSGAAHARDGLVFATLFYLVFFASNIIYNIRLKQKFASMEISMLLSNSFLYLGAGLFFLHMIQHGEYQGIFVITLAVFNFVFAYLFFRKQQIDKNLIYLLIALVLTFISLAGPVQLNGNYITLFWAAEAVILYWLGVKSKIQVIKNASVVIVLLCIISLGMDWHNNYFSVQVNKLPVVLNKAFITGCVVMAALLVKVRWVRKDEDVSLYWGALPLPFYQKVLGTVTALTIFMVGIMEVGYQAFTITRSFAFRTVMDWAYVFLFLKVLLWFVLRYRNSNTQKAIAAISAVVLLLYPLANESISDLRTLCLSAPAFNALFHFHYLIPLGALGILTLLILFLSRNYQLRERVYKWGPWFLTIAGLFVLSSEIVHIWVVQTRAPGFHWSEAAGKAHKVGLPILWGIVSLSLMWIGMKKRIKQLRIISLSLFTLTIAKLFLYDISNVGQGGKIAAFIILGVILLIVSFMYQKIKDLFTDEKSADADAEQ